MSDTDEYAKRAPLDTVEVFEAAAFRVGQVARRLLTDHPDLPVKSLEPTLWVLASDFSGPDTKAELEVTAGSVDDVRAWAAALEAQATVTVSDRSPYERAEAEAEVDGVTVKVTGSRSLTGEEYAAWQTAREQAAAGEAEKASGGEER